MIHCFVSSADPPYIALAQSAYQSAYQKYGMIVNHWLACIHADIQLDISSKGSAFSFSRVGILVLAE